MIDKNLEYTRANPTFHYWKTAGRRYGLAFQTSTEALMFERSVRASASEMAGKGTHATSELENLTGRHGSVERALPCKPKVVGSTPIHNTA